MHSFPPTIGTGNVGSYIGPEMECFVAGTRSGIISGTGNAQYRELNDKEGPDGAHQTNAVRHTVVATVRCRAFVGFDMSRLQTSAQRNDLPQCCTCARSAPLPSRCGEGGEMEKSGILETPLVNKELIR